MEIDKLLRVNSNVQIALKNPEHKEDEGLGQSLIQAVYDKSFLIMVPIIKGHVLYLTKGDEVIVSINADNARYSFESVVLNKKKEADIKYLELKKPLKFVSSNRRKHFRIKILKSINYQIITDEDLNGWENIEPVKEASMIDLSGQGLNFLLNVPLARNVTMVLKIHLDDTDIFIKLLGKVVRNEERDGSYKIGVNFENISERQQDQIVRYVFYTMRKRISVMRDSQ